jgi:hypothetical protein
MRHLWRIKWHWGEFSPSISFSPANSHSITCCILSSVRVTIDRFWIDNWIIGLFDTALDYTSQITVTLLGTGFQRRAFLCVWAHVLVVWRPTHTNLILWPLSSCWYFLQLLALGLNCIQVMLRPTSVDQSILVPSPIWGPRPDFCYFWTVTGFLMGGALSDGKRGLSFVIAAGPPQRSHLGSESRGTHWPNVTVSDSWLPLPVGPCPSI